ncbi:MAG TPA: DUF4012 domain-containing protein [Candidatus Moranbacteria bacterium]|nr:DUF4012 domain-containing protein [Candidatus Moranbacteria bacterium]
MRDNQKKQNYSLEQSFLDLVETDSFLKKDDLSTKKPVLDGWSKRKTGSELLVNQARRDHQRFSGLQKKISPQAFVFQEHLDYSYLEFNRIKRDKKETPPLIKSSFIPEHKKIPNSDIIRKGSLPFTPRLNATTPLNQLRSNNKLNRLAATSVPLSQSKQIAPQADFIPPQKLHAHYKEKKQEEKLKDFLANEADNKEQGSNFFSEVDFLGWRGGLSGWWKFAGTAFAGGLVVFGVVFGSYAFQLKGSLDKQKTDLNVRVKGVKTALEENDLESLTYNFDAIQTDLNSLQSQVDALGGDALDLFSSLPYLSRLSSGKNLIKAGNSLADAGADLAPLLSEVSNIKNPFSFEDSQSNESLTELFLRMRQQLLSAKTKIESAQEDLEKVKDKDVPENYRDNIIAIKKTIPRVIEMIDTIESNSQVFLELLGHNGPRKYLLLFQNNHEMRATGGFIGSYGLISVADGRIKDFKIEGIYNPDGQLREKVIPPEPIQKISAGWSTHDANWFPHFPTSAQKVAWFYEKTGGPTIDGVITFTPDVLQRMLEVTGPIEMADYNKIITEENFNREIRRVIEEVDQENKEQGLEGEDVVDPKGILADLAPQILARIFETKDPKTAARLLSLVSDSLKEKQILFYSSNSEIQQVISSRGWAGEIMQVPKDYLMVINTNVNGFKTDGVIDESIDHKVEVDSQGNILGAVKIKRVHKGGQTDYSEWNKVNANYMRVYVPKGSRLLSVSGQVREFTEPPVDYKKLGFVEDPDVKKQESGMVVDFESGTRIYEEEDKTVFANWNYVSPGETVEVFYNYQLPFKWEGDFSKSYSVLYQKQAGSLGSKLRAEINLPMNKIIWQYPQTLTRSNNSLILDSDLKEDRFLGVVLEQD